MDAQKIMEWKDQAGALLAERGPRTSEQMAELTQVRPAEAYQLLEAMTEEGRLFKTRKERYALPETLGLLRGRLQGNARGFGFLIPEKEDVQDVFIPADAMNGALHGDTRLSERGSPAEEECTHEQQHRRAQREQRRGNPQFLHTRASI